MVRAYLLASGSPIETVDGLGMSDYQDIYLLISHGMVGPYKDYAGHYHNYLSSHQQTQQLVGSIQGVLGNKYKPQKPVQFHEMYPEIDKFMNMGERQAQVQEKPNLAKKLLKNFGGQGVPDRLKGQIS